MSLFTHLHQVKHHPSECKHSRTSEKVFQSRITEMHYEKQTLIWKYVENVSLNVAGDITTVYRLEN